MLANSRLAAFGATHRYRTSELDFALLARLPTSGFLRTRCFYEAMGFVYVHVEHFPADPENPVAYYLKQL